MKSDIVHSCAFMVQQSNKSGCTMFPNTIFHIPFGIHRYIIYSTLQYIKILHIYYVYRVYYIYICYAKVSVYKYIYINI